MGLPLRLSFQTREFSGLGEGYKDSAEGGCGMRIGGKRRPAPTFPAGGFEGEEVGGPVSGIIARGKAMGLVSPLLCQTRGEAAVFLAALTL